MARAASIGAVMNYRNTSRVIENRTTVFALEKMLSMARRGALTGISGVGILENGEWIRLITGECCTDSEETATELSSLIVKITTS